jgi:hypothetical protein
MSASVHFETRSQNVLPVCLWQENPNRLVSLWDVIKFAISELINVWPDLHELHMGWILGGEDVPDEQEIKEAIHTLVKIAGLFKWQDLIDQANRLLDRSQDPDETTEGKKALVEDLRDAFQAKVKTSRVVGVEPRDDEIFENATFHLCGHGLHPDLAISEEELNLAGRAVAFELSTAAVFHSMRAVEASLHALCRTLLIDFPGGIESQQWNSLTEKIQKTVDDEEQAKKRGLEKGERLKRLSELMIPADGFRLAWRNHVAHARERYEEWQAHKILGYVGDFLKTLSACL